MNKIKSGAERTIEFAILFGLVDEIMEIDVDPVLIVKSIKASLFDKNTLWAIRDYMDEIKKIKPPTSWGE